MTKIIGLANSCKDCPNRHYYSSGAYECALVQNSRLNADNSIPGWCPLSDYPAAPVADSAMAKDAERWRWLKMRSSVGEQQRIMSTPWGQWDAFADAAIAAKENP